MTIPNLITIGRFLAVPVILYAMAEGAMLLAFVLFLLAGLSDAVDGIIARSFDQQSELGAKLDPVADKLLIVSVFIMLFLIGHLPVWLLVLVVSRDVLVLAAVAVSSLVGRPVKVAPIFVSKANTAVQIALVVLVLAELAFSVEVGALRFIMILAAAGLTVLSGAAYFMVWIRHMAGSPELP
ncbi:CDP-alcohol phosphatidyltransferase family protein [Pararhizobium sp.]|uniref:CDP-alcohol phosphatidyltransferase family protein n=1 Tax=Pararhizobium sp. TaxID=1977563 RepID=UPI002721671C|nr:CDP-alcohol phosphatidyltransferase family protein [Pararhizobium sp.]MDO9416037.1 CDP-alcohol phosphatidyltransferase family protein [Pararhizobium sp.]